MILGCAALILYKTDDNKLAGIWSGALYVGVGVFTYYAAFKHQNGWYNLVNLVLNIAAIGISISALVLHGNAIK